MYFNAIRNLASYVYGDIIEKKYWLPQTNPITVEQSISNRRIFKDILNPSSTPTNSLVNALTYISNFGPYKPSNDSIFLQAVVKAQNEYNELAKAVIEARKKCMKKI